MKILIVEDDFASRTMVYKFLKDIGDCDVVVDGQEAVEAFQIALDDDEPYDLVCLDIMLPKKDGHTVLKEIRRIEEKSNIFGLDGSKVIMTTALDDSKSIIKAFRSQCEAYLAKPISKKSLIAEIENLGLLGD